MITKQIIDQIEGEATVYFDLKDNLVEFSTISFTHFRGMQDILKGKNALDALVYSPRVCGICGHSHLLATTKAIEDSYKNTGYSLNISKKADDIREFTLLMEHIQNHFKWLYLVIIPQLEKLNSSFKINTPLKGAFASNIASKAIATFAGQWPHSSYMIPGGVTCDPTHLDRLNAQKYLDELILFFEKETLGTTVDNFLSFESCKDFNNIDSDIAKVEQQLIELKMNEKGFAHDRFVVLGEHNFTKTAKINHTRAFKVYEKFVTTKQAYSPNEKSFALNALYKDNYYEVGPLARTISLNLSIIKNMHRRFKDSAYTRVLSRVFELAYMLNYSKKLLQNLDISESSFCEVADIKKITAKGVGIVEAPRGVLIHRIDIEDGTIKDYEIVTPTQWNIGSSTKDMLTPVQKAMINSTKDEATFIFRTFDVCSVCTTH